MLDSSISQLQKTATSNFDVFCTQLSIPSQGLKLSIDPLGPVEFPVATKKEKSLIVEAERHVSLKEQTLLDRKIRDTREILKARIHTNQKWDAQLERALQKIQKNLNLPDDGLLTAELHNLLIYMPGQFFKSHQDSEKAESRSCCGTFDLCRSTRVSRPSDIGGCS